MPNPENLRTPTHEQAVATGRLGGLAAKPAISWLKQKWCQPTCIRYNMCPAISTSQGLPKIKNKHPCFIKQQPIEIQNYFFALFQEGEIGLIKIIMDLHFRLMLKTQSSKISAKELKEALEITLNMKKGLYGDKDQGNQTVVNVIIQNGVDV